MCGRYYVDDETSREIEKIVRKLDQRLKIEHGQDIHPSESAVILTKECKEVAARQMQWGFPGFQGKGLLINARAEAIKKDKRVLLKLLLLGDKIELNEIENTIGTEFLNLLIELGIVIKSDGYVQTDSYIIISFLDKYFLVGLPYNNPNCRIKDPSVYIGMDT